MASDMLVVRGIEKRYPAPQKPLEVLCGVSFELGEGETFSIMGPSGSGKSTLLNIIGTLDSPTAGSVMFEGRDVHKLSPRAAAKFRNEKIGFVFQEHHLLPQCTALENVLVPSLAFGSAAPHVRKKAEALLAGVGLADRGGHFPAELSGGERQRVAIARGMVMEPKLLLCDEPTGNLDSETAHAVGELFANLSRATNVSVIAVTHNRAFAELFGGPRLLKDGILHD